MPTLLSVPTIEKGITVFRLFATNSSSGHDRHLILLYNDA
jgi:hypothetical protein